MRKKSNNNCPTQQASIGKILRLKTNTVGMYETRNEYNSRERINNFVVRFECNDNPGYFEHKKIAGTM